ncbi:hypothetical protein FQV27_17810 [Paracoccus aurantiacus]|uniref:Uncharacterized protein n=1 Tax=Paracoccus aurantiacus TaxID=2599412 RepID=A0A5C6RQ16_9RHOB|nr:hypothetical protein [Paracoccus aurantiacus]TXB64408.1 hypothetical protein FQV27_17810 [Paracoccus aurantiacus]
MKHIWIGFTIVMVALVIGGWLWLRNEAGMPFSNTETVQPADPDMEAVMERVRQEQAEALAEDAATAPAEPQTEDQE